MQKIFKNQVHLQVELTNNRKLTQIPTQVRVLSAY